MEPRKPHIPNQGIVVKVVLWKGYHAEGTLDLVRRCWEDERLLILCPPPLADFRFLDDLGAEEVELAGNWPTSPSLRRDSGSGKALLVPEGGPGGAALGLFTTGTTRETPKLVLYSKRNVESCLDGILSFFDTSRIRSVFCYPQPSHTFGLCLGYMLCLLRGYRLLTGIGKYSRSFHELRASIEDESLLTLGTPTHFQDLLTYVQEEKRHLAPSYSAIIGGAAVKASLWRDVQEKLHIESPSIGYGATEACPGVTHLPPGREPREDGEIGFPLPHLQVSLRPDGLEFTGASVCLATLCEGKLEFPKKLSLADRVRKRGDGVLVFEGRNGLCLNRGGEKFSLEQLESFLKERMGLESICVPLPDARLGEELGIVAQASALAASPSQVIEALHSGFGRRFSPGNVLFIGQLPRNESAKVDRGRCRELLFDQCALMSRYPIPVEELQAWVPHRPPMVWVNEVLWATADEGECRVRLDAKAHYFSESGLRLSTLIEWVAQAYGYVQASRALIRNSAGGGNTHRPSKAYLVGLRDTEFFAGPTQIRHQLQPGEEASVIVRRVRELGPVSLVDGEVRRPTGERLLKASLKLYAE